MGYSVALLMLCCLVVQAARTWLAIRYRRQLERQTAAWETATVSQPELRVEILQPILSGDPLLESALAANAVMLNQVQNLARQSSFQPQLIWLIDQDDIAGQNIAASLQANHSGIRVFLASPAPPDVNPKAHKLDEYCRHSTADKWIILDDDCRLSGHAMQQLVRLSRSHDLACGMPVYESAGGSYAKLIADFVNANATWTYLPVLNFSQPLSINGMCYVVDSRRLSAAGGFAAISHELCDDYALRKLAYRNDWSVVQGVQTQLISTSVSSPRRLLGVDASLDGVRVGAAGRPRLADTSRPVSVAGRAANVAGGFLAGVVQLDHQLGGPFTVGR